MAVIIVSCILKTILFQEFFYVFKINVFCSSYEMLFYNCV